MILPWRCFRPGRLALAASVVFVGLLTTQWLAAAEFYVSPTGSDKNAGTKDDPFATLVRAREAVRRFKKVHPREEIAVLLRGGTYRVTDTIVFSLEDSGSDDQRITYAAYPGEVPILSAATPVPNWQPLEDPAPGLPKQAHGKVWVADASFVRSLKQKQTPSPTVATQDDRGWSFFTLYTGGTRLPRARGPGFSPTRAMDRGSRDHQTIHFTSQSLRSWPRLEEAELLIIPSHFWVSDILPLESVDEAAGTARAAVPGTYPLGKNGMTDRPTAWIENVFEALDEPGEWVLDSKQARLYLWPESGRPPENEILVPTLAEIIRIEGKIDYDGPRDTPVKNLVFRGLTFTHGDRFSWHGQTGWGLQHDWERFDSPSAMLRLRGAEGCAVEDCRFTEAGSTGVRLDLHARENHIRGNRFDRLGGVGILLAGYGPGTKDVNRANQVTNNYVHDIGQLYWGSPAIFAWQSGENRIAQNHIHHIPYTGICVTGRISWDPGGVGECSRTVRWKEVGVDPAGPRKQLSWHQREPLLHSRNNRVERNEIHNAMEVTGDGNCIYVSGAGAGNVVREDYCHDCYGRYMNAVIRCDDDQHGTLIERNLLHRTRGYGEGIISKGENDILGNIIADLRPQDRHRGYLVFPYGSPKGSKIERNVFYSCCRRQIVCGEGSARGSEPAPRLSDTDADFNLYFCTEDPDWGKQHLNRQQPLGVETHSLSADPQFIAPALADFRFRLGSPALKLGIEQPIAIGDTGLETPYRQRWVGRRLSTVIESAGGVLRKPVRLVISCDLPQAEIHYTLDGSPPTLQSPVYRGPFAVDAPTVVRARAFAEGATDLVGAEVEFTPPPPPIVEDFEACRVGDPTPGATTSEGNAEMTARVTDEQAAAGLSRPSLSAGVL
ncbi:MAG: right-handed parallel beta-helix repeat-containing protein [Rhodopirellula sp.]|nr:right-handed parallel beta-helix repeat-containing protein [Rhodopirellula sp.]